MLVLASGSPYRRELLARLKLPFQVAPPDVNENPLPDELPVDTCLRLAVDKACKAAESWPNALIIGSDQVAVLEGEVIGKPGNHDMALRQLRRSSGQDVIFHTALCLLNAVTGHMQVECVDVKVRYRPLTEAQIERYLRLDKPYDCAGSGRIETLGITLVEWVRSDDPTALIGLPLITLTTMLQKEGIELP